MLLYWGHRACFYSSASTKVSWCCVSIACPQCVHAVPDLTTGSRQDINKQCSKQMETIQGLQTALKVTHTSHLQVHIHGKYGMHVHTPQCIICRRAVCQRMTNLFIGAHLFTGTSDRGNLDHSPSGYTLNSAAKLFVPHGQCHLVHA